MDALAAIIGGMLVWNTFAAVALALCIAASGWHASVRYYDAVLPALGSMFVMLVFCGIVPFFFLLFWEVFTNATSPYPLLLALLVVWSSVMFVTHNNWRFHMKAMALELYHLPRWFLLAVRIGFVPHLASQLSFEALEPAAKARAAELRARLGIAEGAGSEGRAGRVGEFDA